MQTQYLHQQPDWPILTWDDRALAPQLGRVIQLQENLSGRMQPVEFDLRQQATLETLSSDVVKTSAIEGETLDPARVRSSIAWQFGIGGIAVPSGDEHIEGIVHVTLDSTQYHSQTLTEERLFGWHAALFPTGRSGRRSITVGAWRIHPIQVVSGAIGQARVHFEGPQPSLLPGEMAAFLEWLNGPPETSEVMRAAIAHLWFVTIHPFDDGNGRITRAIADMCLARADNTAQRFYGMSAQIHKKRNAYYRILEQTQKEGTNITSWLSWFLDSLEHALHRADASLDATMAKARFWQSIADVPVNYRQARMLTILLDDFKSKLTTAKWVRIAKCSHGDAQRDIDDLISHRILARNSEGGRAPATA